MDMPIFSFDDPNPRGAFEPVSLPADSTTATTALQHEVETRVRKVDDINEDQSREAEKSRADSQDEARVKRSKIRDQSNEEEKHETGRQHQIP